MLHTPPPTPLQARMAHLPRKRVIDDVGKSLSFASFIFFFDNYLTSLEWHTRQKN